MSTITVILDPDADGTLHLPLPPELRHGKVQVTATLQPVNGTPSIAPLATAQMVAQRKAAFQKLRELGGLRQVIPNPVTWQREMRQDRKLPGRD